MSKYFGPHWSAQEDDEPFAEWRQYPERREFSLAAARHESR
jgi:hypothetical protein